MAKTITITDVLIDSMTISSVAKNVTIDYRLRDTDGRTWEVGKAVFWKDIPETASDGGQSTENWFQLPASYAQMFADLLNNAQTALENKFLN